MSAQNATKRIRTLINAEEQQLASMSTTTLSITKATSTKTKKVSKKTVSNQKSSSIEEILQTLEPSNKTNQLEKAIKNKESNNLKKKTVTDDLIENGLGVGNGQHLSKASQTTADEKEILNTISTTTASKITSKAAMDEGTDINKSASSTEKKIAKSKKNKKTVGTDNQNISVKASFCKFDALQKHNLIHVRSRDADTAQAKFSNPQNEKDTNCRLCSKPVYKMEEIKAEKSVFHKNCFRCHECNKQLKVDNFQSHEGILYCMIHFKVLFAPKYVEDNEPDQLRKPELIIRENQPIELPPDVVRASDKTDLGLEELHQLNVHSRFQVFERGQSTNDTDTEDLQPRNERAQIKRSTSMLSKLAKLQAKGLTAGINAEEIAAVRSKGDSAAELEFSSNSDTSGDDFDEADLDLVRSKESTQRERPVGIGNAMNDIKTKFEKGHLISKEERREERKQEIQNIRSRLFMGKQARIKEMYQQAVADSVNAPIAADKKLDIECEDSARSLKERFEKGDIFKNAQGNDDDRPTGNVRDEAEIFESAISKKSRHLFMQLDANAAGGKNQIAPTKTPQSPRINKRDHSVQEQENMQQINSINVIKCDEKADDVRIETSEISQKFKFFETYCLTERKRKEFRITPPRDGVVKIPTPDSDAEKASVNADTDSDISALEKSHTTAMMLNKFREMEQKKTTLNDSAAQPRPLKCFTPPPDENRRFYQDQESENSSQDDADSEEDDDGEHDNYRSKFFTTDQALLEAQSAARAKQLRAKFEKWEANEVQRELKEEHIDLQSPEISDETIESTKSIRERFENMKNSEQKSPSRMRYQVNRFV